MVRAMLDGKWIIPLPSRCIWRRLTSPPWSNRCACRRGIPAKSCWRPRRPRRSSRPSQNVMRWHCTSIHGASISLRTGISRCRRPRPELVTLAHQDDYFAPAYVARLSSALRRHSNGSPGLLRLLGAHAAWGAPDQYQLADQARAAPARLRRARMHHRGARQGAPAVPRQPDLLSERHVQSTVARRFPVSGRISDQPRLDGMA